MSADPLKAIRELIGAWLRDPIDKYYAESLVPLLTAAEQEIAQFVSERDNQKKISLAALNMNEANEARANSAEQELREREGQRELTAEQADSRVAAAFGLAAHICDPPEDSRETDLKDIRLILAKAIRALTPPEATAELEKMLMERALQEAEWWLLREDWHMYPDHISKSCATCEHVSKLRAALTGEKKA